MQQAMASVGPRLPDGNPSRLATLSAITDGDAGVRQLAALELGSLITARRLRILEDFGGAPASSTREVIDRLGVRPVYNSMAFLAFFEALGSAATRPKADFKLRRHAEAGLIAQAVLRSAGEADEPRSFLLPLVYDFAGFFGIHEHDAKIARTVELSREWGLDERIVEGIGRIARGEPTCSAERAAGQALRYVGGTTAAVLSDDEAFGAAFQRRFSLDESDPIRTIEGLGDLNARVDFLFALTAV